MNLGLQLAAFVFLWPHLSQPWQIVCVALAIVDLLGGVDLARSRWMWTRRP